MTKIFVLDTNILLSDSNAPFKFGDNMVVIPMAVLEELDNIKMRKNDLSRDARAAVRTLNSIIGDGDPTTGIPFGDGAELMVLPDIDGKQFPNCLPQHEGADSKNDNKIINTAAMFTALNEQAKEYTEVIMVSNDINMRLKAKAAGVTNAQEYKNDIVVEDPDLLPDGYVVVENGWLDSIPTDEIKRKSCGNMEICGAHMPEDNMTVNTWIYPEDESWAARIVDFDEQMVYLEFHNTNQLMSRRCAGITPRSIQQSIMMDAVMNKDIDIVVVDGAAGSGKTLLAMACGTEMVNGKRASYRAEKITFTRSNTVGSDDDEIGFLKGGETEKMAPWLGAATDNMEVIGRATKNAAFMPEKSIFDEADAFIELKAMLFFRGRSLNHRVLIIDEAQNLTARQVKTVLTRAGEHCKVILLGNLQQLDNDNLTARSSGLTYAVNKLHGQDFAQVIKLEGVERSRLASYVESEF